MLSRRVFCCAGAIVGAASGSRFAVALDQCTAPTTERQAAATPDDILRELKAGNERFATGTMRNCDLLTQVRATAGGQFPLAAVLGCIDSRVPPELVLDQHIGDIFSARIAGNFVDLDIVGSLEFATRLAGAKLIVVLGHTECGAIKGAIDKAQLGDLTQMLAKIAPAVDTTTGTPGERTSKNADFVQAVAERNVVLSTERLLKSSVLRELVEKKSLLIVGAMHDVATGRVRFGPTG